MDDINELMGMDDHNEPQKYSQANDQDITQKSQNWTPLHTLRIGPVTDILITVFKAFNREADSCARSF